MKRKTAGRTEDLMSDVFAVADDDYLIDYQNMYTFLGVMSLRNLFISSASAFLKEGERFDLISFELYTLCIVFRVNSF